jgi:PhzF family phenazine biosynthesis protein
VQAFSDKPFAGNPAAVFLIPPAADGATHESGWSIQDIVMQKIAAEMRLSETAFVTPADDAGCFSTSQRFLLRWFTPTKEVDLCGHATLASAAALAVECDNDTECFEFETRSGILTAARHRTTGLVRGSSGAFELNLPANPPVTSPTAGPDAEAHRAIARMAVGKDHAPAITELAYSATTKKLLVRMNPASFGRADLEALAVPPADSLLAIPQTGACPVTGVMVTVESQQPAYDFISRYFAPWNGIPEDPVDYVCFFAYSRAPDSHAPSHKRLSPPLAR